MEFLRENVERDGFAVIENFFTAEECNEMIQEMRKLISDSCNKSTRVVFKASSANDGPQLKEKYFMESACKISYFYEEDSIGSYENLKTEHEYLTLNKVGHALHSLNPTFKKYTFNARIKEICYKLKLEDPVICQSMFIFKNAQIGGEVAPHQDATYLYTEPQKLYGIWIALEDTTIENGCLWFEKGSHNGLLYKRFIRNPDETSNNILIHVGESPEYQMEKFIAVPVKRGSCVVIHGKVLHSSKPNRSKDSRNIYTFHVFDQQGTVYSKENWLQLPENTRFLSVYEN